MERTRDRVKVSDEDMVPADVVIPEEVLKSVAPDNGTGEEPEKLRWRKIGGGTFRMANGKIIKPNQVFSAAIEDIPEGFRKIVVPLSQLPDEVSLVVDSGKYEVQAASPGWYNVIDAQGKVINEKSLRQAAAKELIESLSQ